MKQSSCKITIYGAILLPLSKFKFLDSKKIIGNEDDHSIILIIDIEQWSFIAIIL